MCAPVRATSKEALLSYIIEIELTSLDIVVLEHVGLALSVEVLACIAQCLEQVVELALRSTLLEECLSFIGIDALSLCQFDGLLQGVGIIVVDRLHVVESPLQVFESLTLSLHVVAIECSLGSCKSLFECSLKRSCGGSAISLDLRDEFFELGLVDVDDRIQLGVFEFLELQVAEMEPESQGTVVDVAKLIDQGLGVLLGGEFQVGSCLYLSAGEGDGVSSQDVAAHVDAGVAGPYIIEIGDVGAHLHAMP